jgi:hypothetical protein
MWSILFFFSGVGELEDGGWGTSGLAEKHVCMWIHLRSVAFKCIRFLEFRSGRGSVSGLTWFWYCYDNAMLAFRTAKFPQKIQTPKGVCRLKLPFRGCPHIAGGNVGMSRSLQILTYPARYWWTWNHRQHKQETDACANCPPKNVLFYSRSIVGRWSHVPPILNLCAPSIQFCRLTEN